MVSLPDLIQLGARQSWYGVAEVRAEETTRSSMAHATSLGRTVAASGICRQWPERVFRFTINATGDALVITAPAGHLSGQSTGPSRRPQDRWQPVPQNGSAGSDRAPGLGEDSRQSDIDEFYRILDQLTARLGGPQYLRDCTGSSGCPPQGVYFFYEDGEHRIDGRRRMVRVGTHALAATSKATLWGRLRQHRGQLAGPCRSCGSAFPAEPTAATSRTTASRCCPASAAAQTCPARTRLGRHAERAEIRGSGLWNVEHVTGHYEPRFLQRLARLVDFYG
jgi:hypothetical protein